MARPSMCARLCSHSWAPISWLVQIKFFASCCPIWRDSARRSSHLVRIFNSSYIYWFTTLRSGEVRLSWKGIPEAEKSIQCTKELVMNLWCDTGIMTTALYRIRTMLRYMFDNLRGCDDFIFHSNSFFFLAESSTGSLEVLESFPGFTGWKEGIQPGQLFCPSHT